MDENTANVLTALITVIGGIVSSLVANRVTQRQAEDRAPAPGRRPPRPIYPPATPAPTPPFYRNPIFIAGLSGAVVSLAAVYVLRMSVFPSPPPTPTSVPTPAPTPAPATIFVEEFGSLRSNEPADRPPVSQIVNVPPRPITVGRTTDVKDYGLYVWVFVCLPPTESCAITNFGLLDAGDWKDRLDIGGSADDCARFEVTFGIVNAETNAALAFVQPAGISQDELPSFHDVDPFTVRRTLDENNDPISCPGQ